ncbi:Adenylate kinase [Frankliniella fusca]|uniref:Adenylate kinase n=1 Tax=Frankliniella fusca TaxID=407009 RepID=A0AAE1L9H2_9NEOP|nr:Adenylate kinase [Frankliniella fusca]
MQTKNVNIQQAEENEAHTTKNAAMSDGPDAGLAAAAAAGLDALVADVAGVGVVEDELQRPALPPRTSLLITTANNNNTLVRNNNNNKSLTLWAQDPCLPGLLLGRIASSAESTVTFVRASLQPSPKIALVPKSSSHLWL